MLPQPRLILLHKQKTSGRVRFLCFADGILAFAPLSAAAELRPEDFAAAVQIHPAACVREASLRLGLDAEAIQAEAEFQAWVATPAGDVPILLGLFETVDPPFACAEPLGARFIAITESRQLSEVERLLLRRAYEHVLG